MYTLKYIHIYVCVHVLQTYSTYPQPLNQGRRGKMQLLRLRLPPRGMWHLGLGFRV